MKMKPSTKQQMVELEKLLNNTNYSPLDIVQNFPVFTTRRNIARFLAHYEIFKQITDIPGSIVDLGVFMGASTFTWAKLCEIFCPTDILKKVYAFDTFNGFPSISENDKSYGQNSELKKGGFAPEKSIEDDLVEAEKILNLDKHIKDVGRIELVKGDVMKTIPAFIKEKGNGLKISLLNLDLDLFEPTKIALDYFFPKMTSGGIIIIDEYALESFGGETKAVDDFFIKKTGKKPVVKKFPWHSNPSAYIIVE